MHILNAIARHKRLAKDKETSEQTRLMHFQIVCWLTELLDRRNKEEADRSVKVQEVAVEPVSKWRQAFNFKWRWINGD